MNDSSLARHQQRLQEKVMQTCRGDRTRPVSEAGDWIRNGNGLLAPEARLAIYQDAYQLRLRECLRNEFPRVCRVIGEDAFDQLALEYLDHHPSTSHTLANLSSQFDTFLRRTRPPRASSSPDWFDLVIDAARFDLAVQRVFDGPGWDSQPFPSADPEPDDDSAALSVEVCPSLALLSVHFPVGELNGDASLQSVLDRRGAWHYAIHRRRFLVERFEVGDDSIGLLAALRSRMSIQEAIHATSDRFDHDVERVKSLFAFWSMRGVLRIKQ